MGVASEAMEDAKERNGEKEEEGIPSRGGGTDHTFSEVSS